MCIRKNVTNGATLQLELNWLRAENQKLKEKNAQTRAVTRAAAADSAKGSEPVA